MIIELLGQSLEQICSLYVKKFSIPTVFALADQMVISIFKFQLTLVENFHKNLYIHRDIKPGNFVMGLRKNAHTVYIIDYGLAKQYIDPVTKSHIPFKENKKLNGTARFASIHTHLGEEQSRRDDLKCLGHTLIFLAKGELPWQGIKGKTKEQRYKGILQIKQETSIQKLCAGLPDEFARYMKYCRTLNFEDVPDYFNLKKQFKDCFINSHYNIHFEFDWVAMKLVLQPENKKKAKNQIGFGCQIKHDAIPKKPSGNAKSFKTFLSKPIKANKEEVKDKCYLEHTNCKETDSTVNCLKYGSANLFNTGLKVKEDFNYTWQ